MSQAHLIVPNFTPLEGTSKNLNRYLLNTLIEDGAIRQATLDELAEAVTDFMYNGNTSVADADRANEWLNSVSKAIHERGIESNEPMLLLFGG